ncbi:hypothetical protein ACE14D_04620 [Streptomyces sp. Act-28]
MAQHVERPGRVGTSRHPRQTSGLRHRGRPIDTCEDSRSAIGTEQLQIDRT